MNAHKTRRLYGHYLIYLTVREINHCNPSVINLAQCLEAAGLQVLFYLVQQLSQKG